MSNLSLSLPHPSPQPTNMPRVLTSPETSKPTLQPSPPLPSHPSLFHCHPKRGLQTSSVSPGWEHVGNAILRPTPDLLNQNLCAWGGPRSVLWRAPRVILRHTREAPCWIACLCRFHVWLPKALAWPLFSLSFILSLSDLSHPKGDLVICLFKHRCEQIWGSPRPWPLLWAPRMAGSFLELSAKRVHSFLNSGCLKWTQYLLLHPLYIDFNHLGCRAALPPTWSFRLSSHLLPVSFVYRQFYVHQRPSAGPVSSHLS